MPDDQEDINRRRVAKAPPPPPHVAAGMTARKTQGFDPRGSRLAFEVVVGVVVIGALGAGLIFAGGAIAAALTPIVPMSFDETIGKAASSQFAAQAADCENPHAQSYVREIARPLVESVEELPFDFQFRVVDSPEVNAFALPGGYVTVNYGLLEAAESGEEVAGVLGHEIQHALLRHGTKRMLRQMGSSALLALIFGGSDTQSIAYAAGRIVGLSYDRDQESEADRQGVELLLRAKIDPRGFARFFERLSKDSVRPPALLSTHPDPGDRAALTARATADGGDYIALPSPEGISCTR